MLTYEESKTENKLETYEWDNTWWDNRNTACEKHILVIGDSITVGYRNKIVEVTDNKWRVDGFATSKAIDNEYFIPSLDMFIAQQKKYDFILFNNGLHGWHLSAEEYEKHYRDMIVHLKEKGVPMAIMLTTPVRVSGNLSALGERCEIIKARNAAAVKIAEELSVSYIDAYNLIIDKPELYSPDGVHLISEAYDFVAKTLVEKIEKLTK